MKKYYSDVPDVDFMYDFFRNQKRSETPTSLAPPLIRKVCDIVFVIAPC